ncbi:MAG: hypothetical protein DWI23_06140 [Planctomycetota bacterium]|nr:MAG: hypothetical protein DWI23_06140 [Planctomycetota bacterium]
MILMPLGTKPSQMVICRGRPWDVNAGLRLARFVRFIGRIRGNPFSNTFRASTTPAGFRVPFSG